jgi:regulator of sirC expression with transglutaminase-like and TPR domain
MRWTRAGLFVIAVCLCRSPVARADSSLPAGHSVPPVKAVKPIPAATRAAGQDRSKPGAAVSGEMSVADLTAKVRDSTVVISVMGRDGERSSLGAGFAVSREGLIATNLHVIGEARPIVVTTSDGRRFQVTEVYATDQAMDLAVIRVAAKDLKPLELGDSDSIKQGQEVVAIGNPRGFEHSVVSGVVSGIRTLDGKPLIQLAMPIEQGNSGGPLLDRRGRVQGIVTLKSVVSENLGFAVAVDALKPLLKKPNPVPMDRWLTIGALDENEWTPLFGARWRQRAGRLLVEGSGTGFGGRTLLISKHPVPQLPFEMAAWVRLQREDGAAGLAFHFHDNDCHYGFYPSNGRIRLTRFDGPDVYSWHVLNEVQTSAYRPGEWNRLKIRVESGKILGYVNDVLAVESTDAQYQQGQAGLTSFRGTHAEFKGFEVGKDVPSVLPSRELTERVERLAGHLQLDAPPDPKAVAPFLSDADAGVRALRREADRREREAKQLRRLAEVLQLTRVEKELSSLFARKDEKTIDLLRAALLVARIDNDDLDVDAYVRAVDRLAQAVRAALPPRADAAMRLKALDEHLFKKLGFHGSRTDFYNRSNSFLNEVIDDREGIPITLAVLYIELARRLDVNVVGIGLPGRFLVRAEPVRDDAALIDVFDGARRLSRAEVEAQFAAFTDRAPTPDDWRVQSKKQIVQRLVQNLVNIAQDSNDSEAMLRYVDVLLALDPASLADRWRRALLYYETGRHSEALAEVNRLLAQDPAKLAAAADPSQVRQLKSLLESHP